MKQPEQKYTIHTYYIQPDGLQDYWILMRHWGKLLGASAYNDKICLSELSSSREGGRLHRHFYVVPSGRTIALPDNARFVDTVCLPEYPRGLHIFEIEHTWLWHNAYL